MANGEMKRRGFFGALVGLSAAIFGRKAVAVEPETKITNPTVRDWMAEKAPFVTVISSQNDDGTEMTMDDLYRKVCR